MNISPATVDKLFTYGGIALSAVAAVLSTKSQNRKIAAEVAKKVQEATHR